MTKSMRCAKETAKWIAKHELQMDTSIYVDGKRYKVDPEGELVYDIDADPRRYLEYAGDFMSMSFEGPMYNVMNYYDDDLFPGYDDKLQEELSAIFEKFGKYFELGNAWNLSLYDL